MAEINIQRKKKPVWLWVALVLIILVSVMVWYWKYYEDNSVNGNDEQNSRGFRQTFFLKKAAPFSQYTLESKVYWLV